MTKRYPKKRYHQTGKTTLWLDRKLHAKLPGWRKSKSGKTYYEARRNRSDMPGSMI
jgi:hypothetical protein